MPSPDAGSPSIAAWQARWDEWLTLQRLLDASALGSPPGRPGERVLGAEQVRATIAAHPALRPETQRLLERVSERPRVGDRYAALSAVTEALWHEAVLHRAMSAAEIPLAARAAWWAARMADVPAPPSDAEETVDRDPEPRREHWASVSPGRARVALFADVLVGAVPMHVLEEGAGEPVRTWGVNGFDERVRQAVQDASTNRQALVEVAVRTWFAAPDADPETVHRMRHGLLFVLRQTSLVTGEECSALFGVAELVARARPVAIDDLDVFRWQAARWPDLSRTVITDRVARCARLSSPDIEALRHDATGFPSVSGTVPVALVRHLVEAGAPWPLVRDLLVDHDHPLLRAAMVFSLAGADNYQSLLLDATFREDAVQAVTRVGQSPHARWLDAHAEFARRLARETVGYVAPTAWCALVRAIPTDGQVAAGQILALLDRADLFPEWPVQPTDLEPLLAHPSAEVRLRTQQWIPRLPEPGPRVEHLDGIGPQAPGARER